MEDMENKLVASKLSELDTLPEGYKPNLNSKWELLEASMEGGRRKRIVMYRWMQAAAVITGIILLGYLFVPRPSMNHELQAKEQQKTAPLTKHGKPRPFLEQENKMTIVSSPRKMAVKLNKAGKESDVVEEKVVLAEVKIDSIPVMRNSVPVIASATDTPAKKKKNRYVQLDFSDPVKEEVMGAGARQLSAKGFRIDLFNANAPPQINTYTNSPAALFKIKF
jgi:hypothetical protein